jgi:hypothetical protein
VGDSAELLDALADVVRSRGWVDVHAERDVYTAELVGQSVVARLDPIESCTDLPPNALMGLQEAIAHGRTERS